MAVIVCWVLAVIAGFLWSRWWTGLFTLVTVLVAVVMEPGPVAHGTGWVRLLVLGGTPWVLATLRTRHEGLLTSLHAEEAQGMMGISEAARQLLTLQNATQQMERQIAEITEVYHVTKESSRSLHIEELFSVAIGVAPKLLNATALRLIDLSNATPKVLRATRAPSGELVTSNHNVLKELEVVIVNEAMAGGRSSVLNAEAVAGVASAGCERVAWAPLWRGQKPIGVLIADGLPQEQLKTLSMVADQLSLQLSCIHLYQQVEALAVTDALTGLWVRRHFLERTAEELARARRHAFSCAVLMVDLDRFKEKNDTYGHLVGDAVLKEVATWLSQNLREVDLIGRFGGEEFVLLLVETTGEQALPVAERLRQLVEVHPIQAYDERLTQTISIGVAVFPEDAKTVDELIERADQALYAAKRGGRNRVVRWSAR